MILSETGLVRVKGTSTDRPPHSQCQVLGRVLGKQRSTETWIQLERRLANEPSPAMPTMSWTSTEYWWKYNALETLSRQVRGALWVKVTQSCPTLCDPMDYTLHGILQVRIVEWVAFPFSKGSSQPRDWTQVSRIAGRVFTSWTTREAPCIGIWILYHWATREVPSINTLKELVILQWSIGFR